MALYNSQILKSASDLCRGRIVIGRSPQATFSRGRTDPQATFVVVGLLEAVVRKRRLVVVGLIRKRPLSW